MPAQNALALVLTTVPSPEAGETLVRNLLEERLVACGSLVPGLISLFRWEGRLEREAETLLVLKTPRERVEPLLARIEALHPYELPELLAVPVEAASHAYCRWVRQETLEVNA